MILTPEIHPYETKMQFQDDSVAANSSPQNKNTIPVILSPEIHPHKTKIQFQDDSAARNSSPQNKNAIPG